MSSNYGKNIKLTIFGQSHSKAIGMTLEGIPAGSEIDFDKLDEFMKRRAPGQNAISTARKEGDKPEFLCGFSSENVTCGTPITAVIHNGDKRSGDYSNLQFIPRPGHADYTGMLRYDGHQDFAGGGHFSGRMTAPLCIAGGICKQLLEKEGIEIISRIYSIKDVVDDSELLESTAKKDFPCVDDEKGREMVDKILEYKALGDSVGGIVECKALNVPAGIGDPMFDGIENKIAGIVFGIPAVKGLEFGIGFEATRLTGSENNDEFCVANGKVSTKTNNCGGILGGITNGNPVSFKVAFKPTPSIGKTQRSVDIRTMTECDLVINGRHDPCIVQRAVPVVEAAAAIAIYDALLERRRMNNGS